MGIIIFILITTIFMMNMSPSPLKLSLFLTYISVILSMICYKSTNSVLLPMIVMISFSSGMMILFSYCSITCPYKEKSFNKKNSTLYMLVTTLLCTMMTTPSKNMNFPMNKMMMESFNFNYLIFLMMIVITTMVGINYSFFNPTKKFLMSY